MKKKATKAGKLCPCHSGRSYKTCCRSFHRGRDAKTAEQLMRSRYSAYALGLVDYVIETTHSDSPHRERDINMWQTSLTQFSQRTEFVGLTILKSASDQVTFHAQLLQNGRDTSFIEHSLFKFENGRWYYYAALES